MRRPGLRTIFLAAGLALAGCGEGEAPANQEAATAAPAANTAAPTGNEAAAAKQPRPAAASYALAGNGLAPGLVFGLPQARAVELATAAFGAPTGREHVDCPAGPMDFVNFQDLQLIFEEGRFTGWSMNGPRPELRTAGGLSVGAPRSTLGDREISEDDGFGPGFSDGEISGVLDENETRIAGLSAGSICQFG